MQDKLALLSLSIAIGGLVVGALVIYLTTKQEREAREMQRRERMAALEKGIDLPLAEMGRPGTRTALSVGRCSCWHRESRCGCPLGIWALQPGCGASGLECSVSRCSHTGS